MRWNIILFVGVLFLSMTFIFVSYAEAQVTGEATQGVGISIDVTTGPPTLEILSPNNHSYFGNESLLLNFTVGGAQTIWYNLDNGTNITVTTFTYFNTSQGVHTLHLFANSSGGDTNTTNVTFGIDSNLFNISFTEYQGAFQGDSFYFDGFSFEDMQNLSGIILENTEACKIKFNGLINMSDNNGESFDSLDLDSHTNISFNRVELNGTALPNFNVSATISCYDITFSDPRILIDGAVCSSSICTEQSFSGGTLIFNVTSFSIYSADETTSGGGEDTGGGTGGGGGGGGSSARQNFDVLSEEFNFLLDPGQVLEKEILVRNTAPVSMSIGISTNGISEAAIPNANRIFLAPGEEKKLVLIIIAPEEGGIYPVEIVFKSANVVKKVPVLVNVREGEALLGVSINIPQELKTISPGDNIKTSISIERIGSTSGTIVTLNYIIKDFSGKELYRESEEIDVPDEKIFTFIKKFPTSQLQSGDYVIGVELVYKEGFVPSSALFSVQEPSPLFDLGGKLSLYAIIILTILVIIVIIWAISRYKKAGKYLRRK